MSFFEHYNMGIPLFAPSLEFLTKLHSERWFVEDKSTIKDRQKSSKLPVHHFYNGSAYLQESGSHMNTILDPNNDVDPKSVRHWLGFADFYTLPHVFLFESEAGLVDVLQKMWLNRSALHAIHIQMRASNIERLRFILRYWRRKLMDIAKHITY